MVHTALYGGSVKYIVLYTWYFIPSTCVHVHTYMYSIYMYIYIYNILCIIQYNQIGYPIKGTPDKQRICLQKHMTYICTTYNHMWPHMYHASRNRKYRVTLQTTCVYIYKSSKVSGPSLLFFLAI